MKAVLALVLLMTAAACGQKAHDPSGGRAEIDTSESTALGWIAAIDMPDGKPTKIGEWTTQEECEAELPKLEQVVNATHGECFKGTAKADQSVLIINPPEPLVVMAVQYIPGQWSIQTVTANGQTGRFGPFKTREACEAAIPKIEAEQHTHGSQCLQRDPPPPAK
jgi:hypothetical protein